MNADAQMKLIGVIDDIKWYWADPERFAIGGVYYWDGQENVHVSAIERAVLEAAPASSAVSKQSLHTESSYSNLSNNSISSPEIPDNSRTSSAMAMQAVEVRNATLDEAYKEIIESRLDQRSMFAGLVREMKSQQPPVKASEPVNDAARRYEIVRKLNVHQFQAIYIENAKHGVPFDDLVDQFGKQASDAGKV